MPTVGGKDLRAEPGREGAAQEPQGLHDRRPAGAAASTSRTRSPGAPPTCRTSACQGMVHARVVRPPAMESTLQPVDDDSVKIPGYIGVVRRRAVSSPCWPRTEWAAIKASRTSRATWTTGKACPTRTSCGSTCAAPSVPGTRTCRRRQQRDGAQGAGREALTATSTSRSTRTARSARPARSPIRERQAHVLVRLAADALAAPADRHRCSA